MMRRVLAVFAVMARSLRRDPVPLCIDVTAQPSQPGSAVVSTDSGGAIHGSPRAQNRDHTAEFLETNPGGDDVHRDVVPHGEERDRLPEIGVLAPRLADRAIIDGVCEKRVASRASRRGLAVVRLQDDAARAMDDCTHLDVGDVVGVESRQVLRLGIERGGLGIEPRIFSEGTGKTRTADARLRDFVHTAVLPKAAPSARGDEVVRYWRIDRGPANGSS